MLNLYYRFSRALLRCVFKAFFRMRIHGADSVPQQGGVIVAANHVSYLDPPLLCAALKRRVTYIARKELFEVPILAAMVGFCCIPVDRDNPRPSTIKEAVRRLRDGELIVIFPEGGIPDGERFGEVKRGIGVIAAMSQAPVVPALIMGTERALPVGAKIPRFKRIDVFFEKPINKKKHESAEDFDRRVCSEIIGHIKSVKIAGD